MQTIRVQCPACGTTNRLPVTKQHLGPKCGKCGGRLDISAVARPVELGDADFTSFINGAGLPVLVDFYSPTCGPCRAMAPVLDTLAGKYVGRVIVAKLDTSIHRTTAARYRIRGVPTLLFFSNGQVVDQVVGAVPPQALEEKLQALIR